MGQARNRRKRLLIVDDSEYIRLLIRKYLSNTGFDIKCCSNGEEALELTKREKFNLILSDIIMPVCDGFEFWDRITGDPSPNVATPVLFMSGGSQTIKAKTVLDMFGKKTKVMQKPIHRDRLIEHVTQLAGH